MKRQKFSWPHCIFDVLQYGLKKKEIPKEPVEEPGMEGRLGRKKKTPAEMAAEAAQEEEEESKVSCCCLGFL